MKLKIILSIFSSALIFVIAGFILIPLQSINDFAEFHILEIAILGILLLSVLLFLIFYNINNTYFPIKRIKNILKDINARRGNLDIKIKQNRNDEIGEISKELLKLNNTISEITNFAIKLKNENFKIDNSKLIANNIIGKELIAIKENLISVKKESKYRTEENEKTQWTQTGIANFSALLQQDFETTTDLSAKAIKMLIKYLKVEQGGIFILQKKNDKDVLVLESSYAYDKKKTLDTEFEVGEGLIGKCAKEQKLLKIENLPEGYTFIGSGLGEGTPKSLLLIPLIFEKALFGVIEIASLHQIPEYKISLIQDVGKRIAADISNIQRKSISKKMTSDFKKQAEELKKKEDESLITISKLKEVQKKVAKQSLENMGVMNALFSVVSIVYYDMAGRIIDLNQKNLELFNVKKEDYVGKTHFEFLSEAKKNPEWFKQFWNDLRMGKTRTKEYYIKHKNKELWLLETFSAILGEDGKPEKVINIGIDITKQKKLEQQLLEYQK